MPAALVIRDDISAEELQRLSAGGHCGDVVMNIGEVATKSGLPAKTIRYYEDIGLVEASARRENGYRDYDEQDLNLLKFVQRARSLGFTVEECRELLDLCRASADVKALAIRRIGDIERKIAELQGMQATLEHLIDKCHGDDRPGCPIIDDLSGKEVAPNQAN